MRYFCLCMSPAIDITVMVHEPVTGTGEVHKNVESIHTPGGKGLNVARHLSSRGECVKCGGLLGETNAHIFESELAQFGIEDDFLRVPCETRTNAMIVWEGGSTKLNRPSFPGVDFTYLREEEMLGTVVPDELVILSGALPDLCPADFYARCITHLKRRGVLTVLDASGPAFRHGLEAGPNLVKPNAEECAAVTGFVPKTPDEFRKADEILRKFATHAIISDGANGAWFDGVFTPSPSIDCIDTTGAGDCLLAEYCRWHYGARDAEARFWATAAGAAACTVEGSDPPSRSLVRRLKDRMVAELAAQEKGEVVP